MGVAEPVRHPPGARFAGSWVCLALILVVAAALRLAGLSWGLPNSSHLFSYHPDEFHSLRGALSLLLAGDPNPHFFNYGSLYLYLVAIAAQLTGATAPADLNAAGMAEMLRAWTLAARVVTMVCGLLTVVVVYRLGSLLLDRRLGAVAALALAVMPLHVLHSMYATVDVPLTLLVSLTLLFAARIARRPAGRDYLLAGLCAGLAASVKYSGALVIIAPLVAHLAAARTPDEAEGAPPGVGLLSWQPLVMLAVMAAAFALTSPYTFLDWAQARRDIAFEAQHMRVGEEPARSADPNGCLFHARCLVMTSAGMALVALLGVAGLARRKLLGIGLGMVLFGVVWFAIIAHANVRYQRYELPLTPLIAVLVAAAPVALWRRRPEWRLLALALPTATLGLALGVSGRLVEALRTQPDPRDVAAELIVRMVPPGGVVGMVWEPWFQSPPLDRCNGGQALRASPLWKRFQDPLRPLAVIGLDASRLLAERPLAFTHGNFETRDWERVGDANAREFLATLRTHYVLADLQERPAPLDGLWGWQPPQDWLYPFPTVAVYVTHEALAR